MDRYIFWLRKYYVFFINGLIRLFKNLLHESGVKLPVFKNLAEMTMSFALVDSNYVI